MIVQHAATFASLAWGTHITAHTDDDVFTAQHTIHKILCHPGGSAGIGVDMVVATGLDLIANSDGIVLKANQRYGD